MARLLILGLLVVGVYRLLRRIADSRHRGAARAAPVFEPTVRCRTCGAYVAARHAKAEPAGYVCPAHRLAGD